MGLCSFKRVSVISLGCDKLLLEKHKAEILGDVFVLIASTKLGKVETSGLLS